MNRLERLENLSAHIDGELSPNEQRLLAAWLESHPEDLEFYDDLAEVVALVRSLPDVEPPAGLRERIRRAVAEAQPVDVPREQALEWLDRYFDGDLTAVQQAAVEYYWATDPEFAETAQVHLAMLDALGSIEEQEPPAGLRERIEATVRSIESGGSPGRGAARRSPRPMRWVPARRRVVALSAVAVVAFFWIGLQIGAREPASSPVALAPTPTAPTEAVVSQPPAPVGAQPVEQLAGADWREPVLPAPVDTEEGPVVSEPVVPELPPAGPTPATPEERPRRTLDQRQVADSAGRRSDTGVTPAVPRPAPSRNLDQPPKSAPEAVPAPLPSEGTGRLAAPSGEFIDRSGVGSVLGGGAQGDEGSTSRGPVDPIRRTEVAPF